MSQTPLFRRWRPCQRRRPARRRLEVERLEDRSVPSSSNVLVNDPTGDHFLIDTQSETAVVLGSGGTVVVAFNDSGSLLIAVPCSRGQRGPGKAVPSWWPGRRPGWIVPLPGPRSSKSPAAPGLPAGRGEVARGRGGFPVGAGRGRGGGGATLRGGDG